MNLRTGAILLALTAMRHYLNPGFDMLALLAFIGILLSQGPQSTVLRLAATPARQLVEQVPEGARVIGRASVGPDSAGVTETLIAYFVRDTGMASLEIGRVGALVIRSNGADSRTYRLGEALGETPYAELAIRDLNADGATEVVLITGAGANATTLRIFSWDGGAYRLADEFFGDSGVRLVDLDGDGVDELLVGTRHYDRAQLRHDDVMRWEAGGYRPTYSRWGFTFNVPDLQDYPEAVVLKYYQAIGAHDFRTAYGLLGSEMRTDQPFSDFERGFATTRDVWVEDLELISEDNISALVRVDVSFIDLDGKPTRYTGTWITERSEGVWRLAGAYLGLASPHVHRIRLAEVPGEDVEEGAVVLLVDAGVS